MARFYFHIRKGEALLEDDEGLDLPDLNAAREQALLSAREVVADAVKFGRPAPDCFVITDESGHEVASLSFKEAVPRNLC